MNPYTSYYVNQVGSGLPGFQGIRYQRGHGFFGRLFSNTLLPFVKQLLPGIGKRALPSVAGLAQDILSGENVGKSTLKRLKTLGSDVADETLSHITSKLQKGSGRRRKRRNLTSLFKKLKVYKKKSGKRRKTRKTKRRKRKSIRKKDRFDFLK
jgi:hypothetical protein